jgi:RNA polymerase sigma-70 factor, ECF subfamily
MAAEELIRVCAESNDRAAWNEFVFRFHRPIGFSILRTASQWGVTAQEVLDDLVQETYLKLCSDQCRRLRDFADLHPEAIIGYIKTIAANVAHDHFKALHAQKRGSGELSQSLDTCEPEGQGGSLGGPAEMEREVLLKEVSQALETCSQGPDQHRDCLIFWLYYQQGMSAKAIAARPSVGLTAKGVESAIFRLTRLVRERIAGLRPDPATSPSASEKGLRRAESF